MKRSQAVIMRKIGGFYHAFDEDAYILFHFFRYKIANGKSGFPVSSVNRVKNILEENKVNYIVRVSDTEEDSQDFKKLNRYDHYYRLGMKEYEEEKVKTDLQGKIRTLSKEKVDKLYKIIEELVNE